MPRRFIRRPSPSMVVASIALFVSMGGVSYAVATGSIDSREIKNNDVRGKDVRSSTLRGSDVGSNTLTGSDIVESSLGTVASANNANNAVNAVNAGNANTVGGAAIRQFRLAAAGTLFSLGGLTLNCVGGNIVAAPTVAGRITAYGSDTITDNDTDNQTNNAAIAAGVTRIIAGAAPAANPDTVSQFMHVTWAPDTGSATVTAQFRYSGCASVYGTAVGG